MTPYDSFIQGFSDLLKNAETIDPLPSKTLKSSAVEAAKTVLIFSPHPDDEVIIGALPLRLLQQNNFRVVNVALTLGSKLSRRKERLYELRKACDSVGFELDLVGEEGLSSVNLLARENQADLWKTFVSKLVDIMHKYRADYLFFPHDKDANSTHIGVNALILDALKKMDSSYKPFCILTEFWSAMADPNLMVESSVSELSQLVNALALHKGEVERNPYHLLLPCWMKDNVRRGAEIIGGQGGSAPDFCFATLYKCTRWQAYRLIDVVLEEQFLSSQDLCGI